MVKFLHKKVIAYITALTLTASLLPSNPFGIVYEQAVEAASAPDITSDLVGHYTFDGSLANIASSTGGTAKLHGGAGETWGNPNTGNATYGDSRNNEFGKAYHFLGDTNDSDGNLIKRGEGLQLDAKVTGTDFTISFWVNPEDYGNGYTSLVFANNNDISCFSVNSLDGFRCSAVLGKLWDNIIRLNGDNTEDGKASVDKWTMVTITNKNGEQKLYFDGIEKAQESSTDSIKTEVLKEQDIFLGINWWDPSFKGLMDEVRVYNRALTAEDVAELYKYIPPEDQDPEQYRNVSYERQSVHDPSIIKEGSDYYVFGSHMGVAKTNDLMNWKSTKISGGEDGIDNPYYGTRNADGSVTVVSYNDAFVKGAYGTKEIEVQGGKTVTVDFSSFPASTWNTAVTTNPDAAGNTENWVMKGNQWAPDIIRIGEKYYMYLSLNGNAWNSVVILLTADKIEGPYVYEAPIVYSGFTETGMTSYDKTDLYLAINNGEALSSLPGRYKGLITGVDENGKATSGNHGSYGTYWPHAIDPFVFYDDKNNLWLGYGSWSGGIYMLQLDEETGLRDYTVKYDYEINGKKATDDSKANGSVTSDPYFGKKIAGGYYVSGEGAYVEKIGDYYFLFISYGFYSPTGGYNMRVFRAEKPDGPYVDVNGKDAIYEVAYPRGENNHLQDSRGLQLMGNYQWNTMDVAEVAQGHNSALQDGDGNSYVIYHTKFGNDTADHQLRVHQLYLNEEGWVVAAPYEYAGEKDTTNTTAVPSASIAGDYNLIIHNYSNPKAKDSGTIANCVDIATPKNITLGSDGKITGDYTGTWVETNNAAYATIIIDNIEYKGVFVEQTIDGTNIKTMCFTAVDSLGKCIWGSKIPSDELVVAYNVNNTKSTIPSATSHDLTLNTDGVFGATITWSSSNTSVLSNGGKVSPQTTDTEVTLTKTIAKGASSHQENYSITIYGTESASNDKLVLYDKVQDGDTLMPVSSINESTGVSLTFDIDNLSDDKTLLFLTDEQEWIRLSILNYKIENIFPTSATLSEEAQEILNSSKIAAWQLFLNQKCKATISYNVDGSISFYKDDVLMLTYGANVAMGNYKVSGLSKAIASAVKNGGINVKYPVSNVSIGYALDYGKFDFSNIVLPDAVAGDIPLPTSYSSYTIEYTSSNPSVLSERGVVTQPVKDTNVTLTVNIKDINKNVIATKDYSILVYGTQGANANDLATYSSVSNGMKLLGVSGLSDFKKTGVSLTFDIDNLDNDLTLLILTDAEEWIRLPILNYDVSNVFPNDAVRDGIAVLSEKAIALGYNSTNAHTIFLNQKCTARISYNVDGTICFYRNGELMLTYLADTVIGTKTIADLSKAILQVAKNGQLNIKYPLKNLTIGYADDYDPNYNPAAGYLYYEDYSDFTSNNISKLWKSTNAQSEVTVDSDDIHKNYFHFITSSTSANRSAYCEFFTSDDAVVNGKYTVEMDAQLQSGNVVQRSDSQLVITSNDSSFTADSSGGGVNDKYILKLKTEEIKSNTSTSEAGKPAQDTKIWYINDTQEKVEIPSDSWVHIKACVNTENKTLNLIIANGTTILCNKTVTMTSETGLRGLYVLRGRGTGFTKIDNVKVKEARDFIATYGVDNGNGTYTASGEWYDYTKYYSQVLSENSEIKINFHNWSAGSVNSDNYAVAITPTTSVAGLWENGGTQWHLRADRFNSSTFEPTYNAFNPTYDVEWDWSTFAKMMSDSDIDLTVKRSNNIITISAVIIGSDEKTYQYTVTTEAAPSTGDLTLYLGGENCYLEIYDVQIFRNISADSYEYGSTVSGDITPLTGKTLTHQWYRSSEKITEKNAISLITGTLADASAISGATSATYKLQKDDIGGYIADVITITESNGKVIKTVSALPDKVAKKTINVSATAEDKVYDGTATATVEITSDGIEDGDNVAVKIGDAVFENANAAQDKTVTISNITLDGEDAEYYELDQTEITVTASITKSPDTPNKPDATKVLNVPYSIKSVEEVDLLPEGWVWSDDDKTKTLTVGEEIKATAIYNGVDKGNYDPETVELKIVRLLCEHTIVIDEAVAATCTEDGKTEGSHCSICNEVMKEQEVIPALGHNYKVKSFSSGVATIACSNGCDNEFTITLDSDNGVISDSYKIAADATEIILPTSDEISRAGFSFGGWKDSSGTAVTKITLSDFNKESVKDLTFTASWSISGELSGSISLKDVENGFWNQLLEKITFGLYNTNKKEVIIEATGSGKVTISYLIVTESPFERTEGSLAALSDSAWTLYDSSKPAILNVNSKNVVYVKLVDEAGQIKYLSSDGIIEDEEAAKIVFETIESSSTDSSLSFSVESNEDGTYYFTLLEDSADTLKDTDFALEVITNAGKTGKVTAGTAITIPVSGLKKATNYNAYLVVKDKAGNITTATALASTLQSMIAVTDATITGDLVYGSSLVADASNEQNIQDYIFQWYRSNNPITKDTDVSTLTLIGRANRGDYVLGKEDLGKYIAVVIAVLDEQYGGSALAYSQKPVQSKEITATAKIEDKVYDGNNEAQISGIELTGVLAGDTVTAKAENAVFENINAGEGKQVNVTGITLDGEDATYYQLASARIIATATIKKAPIAPNAPSNSDVWSVANSIETVGNVKGLPEGWSWSNDDLNTSLPIGEEVTANAVYTGEDASNYEIVSVKIKLKRSNCNHDNTEIKNAVAATCTEAGYTGDIYCLACKEKVQTGSEIKPLGHAYNDGVVTKEPTCTEAGEMTYTCSRCNKDSYTKVIDPLGHTIVEDPAVAPTCTKIGLTEGSHCSLCGEVFVEQTPIAMIPHDYGEGVITKEPTVEEEGIRTFTCSVCGNSRTETIPKLPTEDHKHKYTITIIEPTCTENGKKVSICSCGDKIEEIIPALGHKEEVDPAVAPTCTEVGKTKGSHCSVCGEVIKEQSVVPALGHTYGEGVVTKKPTVEEEGILTFTCSVCSYSRTESIPKLPTGEEHEHKYTSNIVLEPTCTEDGKEVFTCSCGDSYEEAIPALGHTIVEIPAVAATCTEEGLTVGKSCSVCGEVLEKQSVVPMIPHAYGEGVVTKEPTVEEEGILTFTCSVCGYSRTEPIAKLPTPEHVHKYTQVITTAATCTQAGIQVSTCSCGDSHEEPIPALGHTEEVDSAVAATCEAEGKTEGSHCSVCNEILVEQVAIPALGHDYTSSVTKEPTVDEEGIRTFICSICGNSYTEPIEKLPTPEHKHDYKSEITKQPTYNETGVRTFTCSICGNSYTEEIPRLTPIQTPSTGTYTPSNGSTINPGTSTPVTPPENTTETQTPSVTEPDKNESDSVVETKPDGTKVETVTESKPDGTVKETITETQPNGTVKEVVTETKADGSTTEIKEVTAADNSATLSTVVETNASGSSTINSVIKTGVSDNSDTVSISESLLQEIAADDRMNSVVIEITDTTVKSATSERKQTVVTVEIPVIEGVNVEKVVLTKESIDTAKETGKGLKVNVVSSTKDSTLDNYSVVIPAKQLAKIDSSVKEINVTINADRVTNVVESAVKNTVTKVLNKNKGKKNKTCIVSLASNEAVSAGMKVTIPVTEKTTITKGSKVYVYKYDAKTGKLVETANCKRTVAKDGSVVIAAASGTDYVISAKKLSGNKVQTIKDSISVSASKKTAKAGKTINVKVSLPDTVSTKSKFGTEKATITYKSSDSKVASVSKSGVITTKKKGTVVVTATVKLASGQKVTKKQEITVK